jgi:hypothetical protein
MSDCEASARRLCSGLGITSSFSKGNLFTEGVFYPECPEILVYARNEKFTSMDLWRDWRAVTPVEVVNHPISSLTVVELGVKNPISLTNPDLAVISIDIPLLAAQWKMWQAAHPGHLIEAFLTQIVLPGMMKSHLNVALFNKMMVQLGIREGCDVKTNLPMGQTPTDQHGEDLIKEVIAKLSNMKLQGGQILATVPVIYGDDYLGTVKLPSMAPTYQVEWALMSQKVDPISVMLEIGKIAGDDRMLREIISIRRTLLQIKEEKTIANGLSTATGQYLMDRLEMMVVSRLPAA